MSKRIPRLCGEPRPANLALQLREAYRAINDLVPAFLVERGFSDIRPAHSSVFEYPDDTGTTVSILAERDA